MHEFLAVTLSFPTVVYSVLVIASLMYWMVSVFGLAGDGDADVGEGEVGDAEIGHAEAGDADVGHADAGDGHAESGGGVLEAVFGLLSFLRLRNAPLSITLSVLFLLSWIFTFFGMRHGMHLIPGSEWVAGTALMLGSLVPAIPLTSLLTKPLGRLFKQEFAPGNKHLVGRVGVVRIATEAKGSAQVRLKDPKPGEKGLLLRVATDEGLEAGDEILLVDYDDEAKAYVAEPMKDVLPTKRRR